VAVYLNRLSGAGELLMSVRVCLRCGVFNQEGRWFECASCGYAPEDPESLTKQLLAQADSITPQLEEIARRVRAGEPIQFQPEDLRNNWTTKAQVLEWIRMCEAIEREECPNCGKPIRYAVEGLSCGWVCSSCDWSVWTTNTAALEALNVAPASAEPGDAADLPRE
jgi:hypothetical protein